MEVFSWYELLWRSTKPVGFQIDHVPRVLQEYLVRRLKLHITPLVPPCPKIQWLFGRWYGHKTLTTFPDRVNGYGFHERTSLSRREASLRPVHGALATISAPIRSGPSLPPPYVPVSRSPVSREASRNLWRSIGPSMMVVFKLRTSLSAHLLCPQIMIDDLIFMFRAKRPVYLRHFRHGRDSRDGCFWPAREDEDSRASHKRRQRAKTWRWGVNWWDLKTWRWGIKVVRPGHRLGGGVGGWDRDRQGELTMRRAFAP